MENSESEMKQFKDFQYWQNIQKIVDYELHGALVRDTFEGKIRQWVEIPTCSAVGKRIKYNNNKIYTL